MRNSKLICLLFIFEVFMHSSKFHKFFFPNSMALKHHDLIQHFCMHLHMEQISGDLFILVFTFKHGNGTAFVLLKIFNYYFVDVIIGSLSVNMNKIIHLVRDFSNILNCNYE